MKQKGETHIAGTLTREAEILTREVVTAPFRLRTYRLLRKILIGFILVSIANLLFSNFFYTPKMYRIINENRELVIQYRILQDRIRTAQRHVDDIRQRDSYVYRSLFATDTLAIDGVWSPYPDTKYASLADDNYSPLMLSTWQMLDQLARLTYLESVSLDELQILSKNKEQLSAAIPAIWPIDRKRLKNNKIGAFNRRRLHPVLHIVRPHNGIDLGGMTGDPIFATGDATVEMTESTNHGYGKQILLDHEFGYKTRYAHLSQILVKPGETVVRGQLIGLMGNTGISTAPHLHYEVIHKRAPVNPVNYFNRDMNAEDYDSLMQQMRDTNFEQL